MKYLPRIVLKFDIKKHHISCIRIHTKPQALKLLLCHIRKMAINFPCHAIQCYSLKMQYLPITITFKSAPHSQTFAYDYNEQITEVIPVTIQYSKFQERKKYSILRLFEGRFVQIQVYALIAMHICVRCCTAAFKVQINI